MKKQFRVIGYPRSGQHGIISWLMGNLPSPSLFINNCTSAHPEEIWYVRGERQPLNFKPESRPHVTCFGLEGETDLLNEYRPGGMLIDSDAPTVVVVRDIKNHMASIMRHRHLRLERNFFSVWEDYARLALEPFSDKQMVICFSLWHNSIYYRKDMFEAFKEMMGLDLEYNDTARNDVMESGGGSSFDGAGFLGTASKMKVNERYKQVNLPHIPDRLLELNTEVFGLYNEEI